MKAAEKIRIAMTQVDKLRQSTALDPILASAMHAIKVCQSNRFMQTYQDLLTSDVFSGCARFFLEELYSERNYTHRDAQFAKVAGTIELTFPAHVVDIAVALATLHATTERLDHAMAYRWTKLDGEPMPMDERYLHAWMSVGEPGTRRWQLHTVLQIGAELTELTKKRGLRLLLKMMHRPAEMAGLGDLQVFLESGFDQFSKLTNADGQASLFLETVAARESKWLEDMFANSH